MSNDINFAVFTADGTKPDVQVCAAGFKTEDSIEVQAHLEGGARDIASLLTSLACKFAADLENDQGSMAAGAFIVGLILETRDAVGINASLAVCELLSEALTGFMNNKEDE